MTKVKLCGLLRPCDIETANKLKPEYVGFVFAPKSRRYIDFHKAAELKNMLDEEIQAVGVFVNESFETVAEILNSGIIDVAQLHGDENEEYIANLKRLTNKPVIKSFRITDEQSILAAQKSFADNILLDSGAGTGMVFDWKLIQNIERPYFLAGGLDAVNVADAVSSLNPYGVDVSSGIETAGFKDEVKMAAFISAVRKAERKLVSEISAPV